MAENNRIEQFDKIVKMGKEGQQALNQYWLEHALFTSFEYWLMVAFLLIPLIYILFKIDKKKIFLIGFYGYSIHMVFGYIDLSGRHSGLWNYPFPVIPMIPGLSLDSSLIPVSFMLVYQWTINNNKNYYLFTTLLSVFFSFVFKPILVTLGLFKMYGDIHYVHLFICYIIVLLIAKFITDVFIWLHRKYYEPIS
ncbi:hypothetical protein [Bacillus sp. Marseille-P3661]|uniref:hypothetical protein n=1 Tax=Bacillus sp. Marseille-P3661 TaxID=1936234 RepID=UPI002155C2CC|nr:hypothetical protein [Bacillus sp. Marseille-P3661]